MAGPLAGVVGPICPARACRFNVARSGTANGLSCDIRTQRLVSGASEQ
jgi:hypothetical protein